MKLSYDCEELIEELKMDIEEMGDIDMYAFFEKVNGITFITNYDFILDEKPLNSNDFKGIDIIIQIMKASDILKILEEQNKIL